jgi:hypothetical protein
MDGPGAEQEGQERTQRRRANQRPGRRTPNHKQTLTRPEPARRRSQRPTAQNGNETKRKDGHETPPQERNATRRSPRRSPRAQPAQGRRGPTGAASAQARAKRGASTATGGTRLARASTWARLKLPREEGEKKLGFAFCKPHAAQWHERARRSRGTAGAVAAQRRGARAGPDPPGKKQQLHYERPSDAQGAHKHQEAKQRAGRSGRKANAARAQPTGGATWAGGGPRESGAARRRGRGGAGRHAPPTTKTWGCRRHAHTKAHCVFARSAITAFRFFQASKKNKGNSQNAPRQLHRPTVKRGRNEQKEAKATEDPPHHGTP